jgi:uncharacterized protein (TIGR01319 family)
MTKITLVIDFGSTYTKIAAFDLKKEMLMGAGQARTTVESDITNGYKAALSKLKNNIKFKDSMIERMLSCSSAAGGLRMVAVGLTKALTTKAAEEAVLGAGAKLIGTYSFKLNDSDMKEIGNKAPDLILLAGGTDGGDEKNIIHNAHMLAQSPLNAPIIVAGNNNAADKVRTILKTADKYMQIVNNILPELDRLRIEPAQNAIREIFIQKITHARGLSKAQKMVGNIIMPTPLAVLKGAILLHDGIEDESGWGDLLVLDVGGATTDIHSIGDGRPSSSGTILKGFPEPYAKRTVEGDLGIRYNAPAILKKMGEQRIIEKILEQSPDSKPTIDISSYIEYLSKNVGYVPQKENELLTDTVLASIAVGEATHRHAGKIDEMYFPTGKVKVQYGKDLTAFKSIIGTGGIFAYGPNPTLITKSACFDQSYPYSLCPRSADLWVDKYYILYAAGLLSEISPRKALRLIKKYLLKI